MNILRCILMGVTFSFYTILRYDLDAVVWDACQQLFNPLSGKLNSNPGLKGTEWHNRLAERVEENVNFPQEPVTIKRPQTPPATTATSTTTSTALPSSTTGSASARVWFLNKLSKLLTKVRAFNASIHSCVCNIWTTVASLSTSVGLGCYKIMDSVELQHLVSKSSLTHLSDRRK
ncbi:hypothetical protein BDY19DRAFT_464621 [Irpex rosettiformis]|uniref:Uncharacterized protein n=1 Tax=Irpex rosettiformis TaxID=378272 RepID=A0ACB8TT11_9APHY|nr:hypothetical protein BDY19DRAFT_464621 [Irpex rosettiformis]